MSVFDAHGVVDEAEDHMLGEHLRGQSTTEIRSAPIFCVPVDVVDPFEEVREPADAALGQRHTQRGNFRKIGLQSMSAAAENGLTGDRV
jgi:hypothetical protein